MANYEIIDGVAILPEGIEMIEARAFFDCKDLKRVVIPQWVRRIGENAFWGCKNLEVVVLPEWLEDIGKDAFEHCSSLKELNLPQWVKRIEWCAFFGCSSLQNLFIPSSVTHIGDSAFSDCSSLVRIKVDSNNSVYDSREDSNAIIHTESNALISGVCECFRECIPLPSAHTCAHWAKRSFSPSGYRHRSRKAG